MYEQDADIQKLEDILDSQSRRIKHLEDIEDLQSRRIKHLENAIEQRNKRITELEDIIDTLSAPFSKIKEWMDWQQAYEIEREFKRPSEKDLLKGKKILVIGPCACRPNKLLGLAKIYSFTKSDFTFVSDYLRIKNREISLWNDRVAAIIIGPVPHNVKGIDIDLLNFITDKQDTIPVIVCKNGKGHLKITKQAFKEALFGLISELKLSY